MGAYSEKLLLEKVAQGNEAAFRELFHRYADLLGTFVLRLTRSQVQTEEIVQDVFLKIWMSREALAGVTNFKVFLYVVARNQALNALRKTLRQTASHKAWEAHQTVSLHPDEGRSEGEEKERLFDLIDQAIFQLPPQQKTAWLLSRREGLTHDQIATQMGLSKETVKKYIMYANESLRRSLSASALPVYQYTLAFLIFF